MRSVKALLTAIAVFSATPSLAQVEGGIVRDYHGLRGRLWSVSWEDQAGGAGAAAPATPPRKFVLTQFCASKLYRNQAEPGTTMVTTLDIQPSIRLTLPTLARDESCQTFEPGIAVSAGATMMCFVDATVSAANCNVTGILLDE